MQVFELREHHRVALLGLYGSRADDHRGHDDHLPVEIGVDLADGRRRVALDVRHDALERVLGKIDAGQFLLPAQHLF